MRSFFYSILIIPMCLAVLIQIYDRVALVVQIYLSISRPDLAKKEQARALKWAEDDLLLQSIEATIGLSTGSDSYADCNSFFTEQLANPSLTSSHLLVARGVARLLKGDVAAANSDLEEVMKGEGGEEALAASVVAAGLGTAKKGEADELYECVSFVRDWTLGDANTLWQTTQHEVSVKPSRRGSEGEGSAFRRAGDEI